MLCYKNVMLESLAWNKHSSLLLTLINYGRKKSIKYAKKSYDPKKKDRCNISNIFTSN